MHTSVLLCKNENGHRTQAELQAVANLIRLGEDTAQRRWLRCSYECPSSCQNNFAMAGPHFDPRTPFPGSTASISRQTDSSSVRESVWLARNRTRVRVMV